MHNRFDLIVFDLDGTLVDTAPEIADAVNDTLHRFDLPQVSLQQATDWIGHGTHELLIQALAYSGGVAPAVVRASPTLDLIAKTFVGHYERRCGTRSRPYPQVMETLTALRGRGVKLAVVTNKEARYTRTVLEAHHLTALLDRVVSGDTLPTRKPHPAGVWACMAELGVPAGRTLFVGDSSIDVATARNAGIPVWALPYGYNQGQPIASSEPDRVIADCSALLD
jgi:phosphoglycolate phosphatase